MSKSKSQSKSATAKTAKHARKAGPNDGELPDEALDRVAGGTLLGDLLGSIAKARQEVSKTLVNNIRG